MPVSLTPTLTTVPLDPRSAEQSRRLAEMYRDYLLEELERTGHAAPGLPVATFLNTLILRLDDEIIGFCALDFTRYAAELIYIEPQYRRQGIARAVFARLKAGCPQPMRAKAPLTPAGQALVESVGISATEPDEAEEQEAAQALVEAHRNIGEHCHHKHGNPMRPCRRCYQKALTGAAEQVVASYVLLAHLSLGAAA